MPAFLTLERLSKRYGGRPVLGPVDARLEAGDFVLLEGENGSGKTTLLRLIAGTLPPSSGAVRWGSETEGDDPRRRFAYVGHQPLLYQELTPLENLALVLRIHARPHPRKEARAALTAFGLADRIDAPVAGLSRGQQQRVALARAFAQRPSLWLLDEPATGLDAQGRRLLAQHLRARANETAVLLATHEPDEYEGLATRRFRLRNGRLEETT